MDFQEQDLENGFESIDIRQYLALFWQWAWLIALATVLAGLAAFLISQRMTPVYSASTTLYINEAPSTKATDYNSIITSERISGTYSKMITTRPVLEAVATKLGIDVKSFEEDVSVSPINDTTLIEITVEFNRTGIGRSHCQRTHLCLFCPGCHHSGGTILGFQRKPSESNF